MQIKNEYTPTVYETAKKVYSNEITKKQAVVYLFQKFGMNQNSSENYIRAYVQMRNGQMFKRNINAFSMNYYLENILLDFGNDELYKALTALKQHIEYNDDLNVGDRKKNKEIYQKYYSLLYCDFNEIEQNQIIENIINTNKSKDEVINELKKLKEFNSESVVINNKKYKRDNKTVAQLKYIRDFKCQICSTQIKKKDGSYYIEAAHIIPKYNNGKETPDNILILCPNHHKEFDYGDLNIIENNSKKIEFLLNDEKYVISLDLDDLK